MRVRVYNRPMRLCELIHNTNSQSAWHKKKKKREAAKMSSKVFLLLLIVGLAAVSISHVGAEDVWVSDAAGRCAASCKLKRIGAALAAAAALLSTFALAAAALLSTFTLHLETCNTL